jgi:sugar phosphate permease
MDLAAPPARAVRWRIPLALAVTMFVHYLDRNNLALALPRIAQEFGWTDAQVGSRGELLLAAFYLSFGISNIALSPLGERLGPRRSTIAAITAFSICTILIAPFGQSFVALIVLRLLLGMGEGVHVPMLSAITSRWFPPAERSRANATWSVGILLATACAPLLIVPLIGAIGWRLSFAVLGAAGLLIALPAVLLVVRDAPRREDGVSEAELALIGGSPQPAGAAPSRAVYVRDPRFWLAVLGGALNAFCAFGTLNWLPIYFNRAKGIDFEALGWPLALVFAAGVAGVLTMAYLGDRLGRRVLLAGVGFLVAGVLVLLAVGASGLVPLVALFATAVFFQSAYTAQEYAIVQRLVPADRVGSGTGLYNGLAVLFGGVGGSLIPGSIVAATGSFTAGISSIAAGAFLAAAVMWVLARQVRY